MFTAFGDVEKYLKNNDLPLVTSTKLLQVLNDPAKTRKLKIELATAMEPFVKATYKLEGDGALSLVAYQQISMLYASVSTSITQMLLLLRGDYSWNKKKIVTHL